ncbi:MAG: SH3 domain-containing protein, partial [Chloroflexota bacterium]|nr:SH3 domain-containing protein [Chloroflexota bacterium]
MPAINRSTTRRDSSPTLTRRSALGAGNWTAAQAVQQYETTTALNFRSGPGTSYPVIRVIPAGGIVAHTGTVQNSFYEVGYGGTYGWVHKNYLVPVGSSDPTPVFTGQRKAATRVNLRSGPSTGHLVLRVVPANSKIGTSTNERNGFLYVSYAGMTGWMPTSYIAYRDAPSGETFTTTARLNLRAEPSTSAK